MGGAVAWLVYHADHKVLVCRAHGFAVSSLVGHLSRQHADIDCKTRNAIVAEYGKLELARPRSSDFRYGPDNPLPAIDGLTVHDGLACEDFEQCRFASISRKRLKVHCKEEHQWKVSKAKPTHWRKVKLQTFFTVPGSAVHYFCVTETGGQEGSPDDGDGKGRGGSGSREGSNGTKHGDHHLVTKIKDQWQYDQGRQEDLQRVLAEGILRHETTNWLNRTGWSTHFNGLDLREIHLYSRMPGPEDDALRRLTANLDQLFFGRCIAGLASMPLMTRLLLASPHPGDAHSRPFGPLQEKTSMERYLAYWKRFLCYCLNVLSLDEATLRKEHGFGFTSDQRAGLQRLWDHLRDDGVSDKALQEELLQLSAGFWMQRLPGDPFESPLWHFIAVLGIDGESGQLRPGYLFTYVLAGLVYVGRALLGEWAIPTRERAGMADLEKRFGDVRLAWLCKAGYSPMGYTLSLLLYGRKIARETGSRLMVSWSRAGDVMYYMGKPVSMDSIRGMVAEMTADAESLLWNSLMFKTAKAMGQSGSNGGDCISHDNDDDDDGDDGDNVRFTIPLANIEDDLTHTQRGRSFIHSNGLDGRQYEMLEDIISSSRKREFLDGKGEWRWPGIQKYLKLVKKFEELLLLLAHITGGQPSRGEEITGLRLVNGINRDRNVFVIDGEVVLVTQYHKSQAHFDSPRVVPRFLPARVGQLMAMYIIYIRPLTDRWEAERWAAHDQMSPASDFIWHRKDGTPWESTQLSAALASRTEHYMGVRITLRDWRHIAIAISKKHARQRGGAKADFEDDEDSDDDAENYETPDDLAASHSTKTGNNYGVTIDVLKRLTAESLEVFGQVSHRWHRFLGCGGEVCTPQLVQTPAAAVGAGPKRKLEAGTAHDSSDGVGGGSALAAPGKKRPRVLALERRPALESRDHHVPGEVEDRAILRALRAVLRDDSARFRSPQQKEAVIAAATGQSPVVAVLPTGGGKSLVFMVPAMLSGSGVTVVVAPFAKLKTQLVQRCIDAGLDCKMWPEARESWPRVTIVAAETASSEDFLRWAADLSVRGRLDRIVVDECHLTFTAADEYRNKLRALAQLRNLGCPFVFLTGTLPPLRQREFEEAMLLQNPLYIRASSHRVNARYAVRRVKTGQGIMEVKRLVQALQQGGNDNGNKPVPVKKGVIYCLSHAKCRALARQLGCHYYHALREDSDSQFAAQREAGFQSWVQGESPYIVATAALGTGIDIPGITHVVHLDAPHSIIDYAQESGRAGRAGEETMAELVVEEKDWPAGDAATDRFVELKRREVNSLIRTQGCRRRVLGQCLDGDPRDCKGISAVLCDNCQRDELKWKSELSSQGLVMSREYTKRAARGMEQLLSALEEIEELGGKLGCRMCWMFEGAKEARHQWHTCKRTDECLSFLSCMDFQGKINYRRDPQARFLSCFYCHLTQRLCVDGYQTKGATCRWKHVILPLALASTTEPALWDGIQTKLAGREFKGLGDYQDWLGRKHPKLVCGQEMTNAMAVFNLILAWRREENVT